MYSILVSAEVKCGSTLAFAIRRKTQFSFFSLPSVQEILCGEETARGAHTGGPAPRRPVCVGDRVLLEHLHQHRQCIVAGTHRRAVLDGGVQ